MPAGRPRKYDRKALAEEFRAYIDANDIPIVAEFAYQHNVDKQLLYDWEEFSYLLKTCTQKKETALERLALKQDVNVTMAIFSLKQLGWSDKNETVLKGDRNQPVVISDKAASW